MRSRNAVLLLAFAASTATAQRPVANSPAPPSDSLIVSLLTLGPGEQLFDRFGHAAIRVRRAGAGLDSAWNWGMYDFAAPNFITRFLTGDTQYWMAGYPSAQFINYYRDSQRDVWEQELNLTQPEADSLLNLLRWNAREENKFYRYDYYLDNCSTRVRDALDRVLGGALAAKIRGPKNAITWRSETLRLTRDFPLVAFGMTFALGSRADEPVSAWDEMFIPMRMRDALAQAVLDMPEGARRIVRAERRLVSAERFLEPPSPYGGGLSWAPAVAFLVAVGFLLLGRAALASKAARWSLAATGSMFALVVGISGLLVLLAGLFTRHVFMGSNVHLLAATPVTLVLAVGIPWALRANASARARSAVAALSVFAIAASVVGIVVHLTGLVGYPGDFTPDLTLAVPTFALLFSVRRNLMAETPT